MKVTVFGATGQVGRQVIAQALAEGHAVTAFTRDGRKFHREEKGFRVVEGDVLDPAAVRAAVEGADAVICALGVPLMNASGLRARGTRTIIAAMQSAGVKRLICLSSLGVGDSRRRMPLFHRMVVFPLVLRRVLADHTVQEAAVRESGLDWTIVRPGHFLDGGLTGYYRHGEAVLRNPGKAGISHADVADFLVRQVADAEYMNQAPAVSY
ncbi:MAG: NAD(P)-dependent oxidoreductase [Minwuia sp.]|uniref:NAD(P)-dependent oxidoreductase n=1 Tax=Minwuia sp. TaxID=2493630 RepID=UPI003A8783F2